MKMKKRRWKSSLAISLFNFNWWEKVDATKEDDYEKDWKNEFDFWLLHIKIRLYGNFHENLRKKIDPFFKIFLTNQGKNEGVNEKNWENEFDLWILHIRIRFYGNFHENLWKKRPTHFLGHFWLIVAKMKMKMKIWKNEFEFSIGYVVVFMKICEKIFDPFFETYLTNRA